MIKKVIARFDCVTPSGLRHYIIGEPLKGQAVVGGLYLSSEEETTKVVVTFKEDKGKHKKE